MPNATTTTRSALSIALLSLVSICAHAEIVYNHQPTFGADTVTNTTSNSAADATDNTQLYGSRVSTQRSVLNEHTASPSTSTLNNPNSWSTVKPTTVTPANANRPVRNQTQAPAQPASFPVAIQRRTAPPLSGATKQASYSTPTAIRTIPANVSVINPTTVNTPSNNAQSVNTPRSMTPSRVAVSTVASTPVSGIPMPKITISHIERVTRVMIPISTYGNEQLDVSSLDDFLTEMIPHARHYPPSFENTSDKYYSTKELQELEQWLRPYAERPDASYQVLLRAAKLNGMARNLDFGSEYAIRASNYISRAIDQQPNSAEANFLYGMMLAEGGGFNEGKKYLEKAVSLGYLEAEQSLAQSDLLRDRKGAALQRLQRLQRENPNNVQIRRQIALVQNGEYYIWDLD